MATFVTTLKFTDRGLKAIADSPKRASAFRDAAKKLGARVISEYWTLGSFDGFLVFEAADEQTASALMLQLASQGNVHTQTARAFDSSEITKVLERIKS